MPKRDLRVIKRAPIALGICERCNLQFSSNEPAEDDAEAEIWAQFDNHKCRSVDAHREDGKPASAEHGRDQHRKSAERLAPSPASHLTQQRTRLMGEPLRD